MFQSGGEAKSTAKGHMPLCIVLILLMLQSVKRPPLIQWLKKNLYEKIPLSLV